MATCRSVDLLLILNTHTGLIIILACIYIDLYGYTDGLTRIRSAGWQLDMYMFIYINGYLPICQHICHAEYTYRACHIYRRVSTLICMDTCIQIGWQVDMYIHWPVYGVYVQTCRPPLFLNLHSGMFIYKHVIGHAGLLSSRASVKAIYGVCISCILLWGYRGLAPPPPDIEL